LAGLVGLQLTLAYDPAWLSASSFVLFGVLVAADVRLPPRLVATLGMLYGVTQGLAIGAALAKQSAAATSLLGSVVTVALLVLLTSAAVVPLRAFRARLAVRIAGSWVVAVGIMMLGWWIHASA
jgi:hydrogenase/urease accessory protein HupE